MEWIFIIAIGFICIACPILILLYLEWMPWYVSVLFAVWILASIGTIVFTKNKAKKWYEKLIPTFIFTFIFTSVFLASMDTNHYMFDENTGLWVVAPALSIPAFYVIGGWLNGKWLASQEQKRKEYNGAVDKEINDKLGEIQKLDHAIKEKTCTIHLLDMLGHCGAEVEQLESDPRISDIMRISSEIERKRSEVLQLEKSKK